MVYGWFLGPGKPNRTAICIFGQPRTLKMPVQASLAPMSVNPLFMDEIATQADRNYTTAQNIQEMLFDQLQAFDVFVFLVGSTEAHPRLPTLNDTSFCQALRPKNPKNHLVCRVELDRDHELPPLMDKYMYLGVSERKSYMNMRYAQHRCNHMREMHSMRHKVRYTHWVSMRPDGVYLRKFPALQEISFAHTERDRLGTEKFIHAKSQKVGKENVIRFANHQACCCGNRDWFSVGKGMESMDAYMSSFTYLYAVGTNINWTDSWQPYDEYSFRSWWSSEDMLLHMLEAKGFDQRSTEHVNACLNKIPNPGVGKA